MDLNGNSQGSRFGCAGAPTPTGGFFPVSAFSAFHLLRNYNYLLSPRSADFAAAAARISQECGATTNVDDARCADSPTPLVSLMGYPHPHYNHLVQPEPYAPKANLISTCGPLIGQNFRRQRGEKKPIPSEQKDDKYYERRRRNNQAAKKSRDARKQREDQIALRATLLEHENALLKAQLMTLRDEAASLRQLLLEKKSMQFSP